MPISQWRVKRLAREMSLDPETATLVLMEAGFDVSHPDHYVPRSQVARARDSLRAYLEGSELSDPQRVGDKPVKFAWPELPAGHVEHLDADFVESVHTALTAEFRGSDDAVWPEGVKERGLLESAVMRSRVAASKYPNAEVAGAALVQALIHNHPFHNGNKRTALLALVVFLETRNGLYLEFTETQIYDLIVSVANHTIATGHAEDKETDAAFNDKEVLAIYEWVQDHTSRPETRDHKMRWRNLEGILRHHGCQVERGGGHQRRIRREGMSVTTRARAAGSTIDIQEIRRIRRELQLDQEHGYDSGTFYAGGDPHPDLGDVIKRYRGVLMRLALLDRT